MTNDEMTAAWAAEDAAEAERAAARDDYYSFEAFVERQNPTNAYLFDEIVDQENALDAGHEYGTVGYWRVMLASARIAAGSRADEAGIDLGDLT